MAEEISRVNEPSLDDDPQDDVVGKIDQLLNRHRPRTPATEAIPVLTDAPREAAGPVDDGIPLLTDAVNAPIAPASSRSGTVSSVLILRRMALSLDAEHARLRAQLGGDAAQIQLLDRLVAELKRALPAAVRSAVTDRTPDSARTGDDGRL